MWNEQGPEVFFTRRYFDCSVTVNSWRIRHIWSWFASSVSSENVLYFWCFRRTKSRSRRWDGSSRMDETPGSSPNANSCSFQFWNKFPLLLFGYYSLGVLADSMRLLLPIHLRGLANLPRGSWRHFSTCRARMREEYVRDRKNVNIVTLGASQHGKTLLCSRLTEALSDHGVPVKKVDGIGFRVFYEIVQSTCAIGHKLIDHAGKRSFLPPADRLLLSW